MSTSASSPLRIVLLPGLDGTGEMFTPFVEALGSQWASTVIEYPRQEPRSYDELFELVRNLLPKEEPFLLLGESFSSPIALRIAANPPPNLRAVVLAAGFVRSPWRTMNWATSYLITPLMFRLAPPSQLPPMLMGSESTPELEDILLRAMETVAPAVMACRSRLVARLDATADLKAASVPILYIRSTDDGIVSERSWRQIHTIRPDVALHQMPGPHLVLQTRPSESVAAIEKFVRTIA